MYVVDFSLMYSTNDCNAIVLFYISILTVPAYADLGIKGSC